MTKELVIFAAVCAFGVTGGAAIRAYTDAQKAALAPLLSTASIACLGAPIKGFTKPE